jgi:hypothetical protein
MAAAIGALAVSPDPRHNYGDFETGEAASGAESETQRKAAGGRVVVYYQTQYAGGSYVSPLPLTEHGTGVTDVLVTAVHLNDLNGPRAPVHKVVAGTLTDPANGGSGYVGLATLKSTIGRLRAKHSGFGGVAGWEYFNSQPGGGAAPWQWAAEVSSALSG